MIDSLIAGLSAVDNIQQFAVYENDTNVTDDNTVPAHSVCVVAEGGLILILQTLSINARDLGREPMAISM